MAVAVTWSSVTRASADEVMVEPTAEQLRGATEAARAFDQGDYPHAIEVLNAVLAAGSVNLFYVNLGRAYFRAGRCVEADRAYVLAMTAPAVAAPAPAVVREKVVEYRKELSKQCPGTIMLTCGSGEEVNVSLDDGTPRPCSMGPITAAPGSHILRASVGGETKVREVSVTAMGTIGVVLDSDEIEGPEYTAVQGAGVALAALGASVLGTTLVYDLAVARPAADEWSADRSDLTARDRSTSADTLTRLGYIAGPTLAAVGVSLFLLGPPPSAADEDEIGGLRVWLDRDFVGASCLWRFR